jgi:hypothetical protein
MYVIAFARVALQTMSRPIVLYLPHTIASSVAESDSVFEAIVLFSRRQDCEDVSEPREVLRALEAEQDAVLRQAAAKFASSTLDLENMVPKKSNWDLKRLVAPKLEKLERRTQLAIFDLARTGPGSRCAEASGKANGQYLARTVADVRFIDSDNEHDE